jgi:hypothetical protein
MYFNLYLNYLFYFSFKITQKSPIRAEEEICRKPEKALWTKEKGDAGASPFFRKEKFLMG